MTVVVVPWGRHSSPQRAAVLQRVLDHLHDGGFAPLLATPPPDRPWSPGTARNLGAAESEGETIVFNDADTITPGSQIRSAIELAERTGCLVYAYDVYLRRSRYGSIERELFMPPSMGTVAIGRHVFERLGGFDEQYEGWGYEDVEFADRAARIVGVRRVSGVCEHLWHGERNRDDSPEDADPVQVAANLTRFRESTAGR